MGKDLVTVSLYRDDSNETWGFRLAGGKGSGQPLTISQVTKDSLAAKVGLSPNDFLVSVAGVDVTQMTHSEAEKAIQDAGNRFQMEIERESVSSGRKISFEKSAMTVSLKLGGGRNTPTVEKVDEAFISNVPVTEDTPSLMDNSVDFKKYEKKPTDLSSSKTLQPSDMSKTYNRKDWNCPWVRKDGLGLRQAIRAVEEVVAPAKTSFQHYYSEPKSILAPEPMLSPEQLQEIIRQHGADSRPASSMQLYGEQNGGSRPTSSMQRAEEMYRAEMEAALQEEIMMREDRNCLVEREERIIQDETYTSKLINSMNDDQYYCEREEGSQAPPDLEPVTPHPQTMVGGECYEPSADELIDVLKNLENLAAANPALYRTIVAQIKENQAYAEEQEYYQQHSHHQEEQYYQEEQNCMEYEEQRMNGHEEYEFNAQYEEEMRQQQEMFSGSRTETEFIQNQETQMESSRVEMTNLNETEEEQKRRLKMERLEREAQEEVRATLQKQREIKMAKLHPPEPPKPKEITVIAGDGKPVKIVLGAEKEAEDSRKQVAEAAGLKHVPLPDFDGDFSNSAWAGSLKRTEKSKLQAGRREAEEGGSPWAGSLRHVKERPKKNAKKNDEDLYGTAPWMGTLRHVVHENKVTQKFGVNQFQSKRYPDEDATNPFEGSGGINARPAFPLTPAAIINGSALSRDEMARRAEEEEVQRIKLNIKSSETVSSALLKALMPKLLKMHESKYPALDRDEASKIMEEILAMQVGLNVDQQADANEEAEMMIRAIMQDEIGKSVYSRMADDLEAAAQRRKNEGLKKKKVVKKVKKGPATIESSA